MLLQCSVPDYFWRDSPQLAMASSFTEFLDHTRHTTVGRTPGGWLARRRDLFLTTLNTHKRQTSKPPVGFEPTISEGERTQTYALDRAATGAIRITLECFSALAGRLKYTRNRFASVQNTWNTFVTMVIVLWPRHSRGLGSRHTPRKAMQRNAELRPHTKKWVQGTKDTRKMTLGKLVINIPENICVGV